MNMSYLHLYTYYMHIVCISGCTLISCSDVMRRRCLLHVAFFISEEGGRELLIPDFCDVFLDHDDVDNPLAEADWGTIG